MLGDIFTCLLVTFRLFLALVLFVNVVAWLFDDDDDEDADGPIQRNPDDTVACRSPACIFARPLVAARPAVRPPPRDRQDGGSTPPGSVTGVETLLSDVVEKLATSINDVKRPTGADNTPAAAHVEYSETDSIDRTRHMRQEPVHDTPASNAEFDAELRDGQRMTADRGGNAEVPEMGN